MCDGSLEALYKLIGCDMVEPVAFDDHHTLWIDENGLGSNPLNPVTGKHEQRYFVLSDADGSLKLLAGRALVLQDDEGDGKRTGANVSSAQLTARGVSQRPGGGG